MYTESVKGFGFHEDGSDDTAEKARSCVRGSICFKKTQSSKGHHYQYIFGTAKCSHGEYRQRSGEEVITSFDAGNEDQGLAGPCTCHSMSKDRFVGSATDPLSEYSAS